MIKIFALIILIGGVSLVGVLLLAGLLFSAFKMRKWGKPLGWLLYSILKNKRRW
ncbi:hypothetical protein L9W92_09330 [Pelotomaculum terephthalicicum JT]|uniref:hypothetical protein n=1 Tax=Pelotomaculum TaxID=191373 RepID=UPI0009CFF1BC|nr:MULTISPECIES: hypothetical protein [Pelotomaculum]MCG9968253.1 hypothetical protein [Pelotomaculum terephthalicicum JT]OPX86374.1 MAG: hypothetical protein A4E54_02029 [Pelotomaculum sp. PtaB.Bin117]OPY61331.1 MAG: hypothetical protein A4E56_02116 [Pelotomaculum sp. PtaU1.Bin065]